MRESSQVSLAETWHRFRDAVERIGRSRRTATATFTTTAYAVCAGLLGRANISVLLGGLTIFTGSYVLPLRNQKRQLLALIVGFLLLGTGLLAMLEPTLLGTSGTSSNAPALNLVQDPENVFDNSYAFSGSEPASAANDWTGATKVGSNVYRLTITNRASHPLTVSDIQVIDVTRTPPVIGTLFHSTAEGAATNEEFGVEIDNASPFLRALSPNLELGLPWFPHRHIVVGARASEIVEITAFVRAPGTYMWKFRITYDVGGGPTNMLVPASPALTTISGYVHHYGAAYQQEGRDWVPINPQCGLGGGYC